jgi:hypothetical protein
MANDDPIPWTLNDLHAMGDDQTKKEIEELTAGYFDLFADLDQEQITRVRTGGHEVRVVDNRGACEVQVDIYRTGPKYGHWTVTHSPEGHEVRIAHSLPTSYNIDGRWNTSQGTAAWVMPATDWKRLSFLFLEIHLGKKIATEVNPLFHLPPVVAPDALIE